MQSPWEKLKQFHWNDRRLILVAVIILLVLLMMGFNNRMVRALELEEQAQAMTTRIAELEQTKVYLEAQIAFATSEKAVEQWAREDAKLIKEGDIPLLSCRLLRRPLRRLQCRLYMKNPFPILKSGKSSFWGNKESS